MIAFVLSGGGNRGALEVGALKALFEAGIRPDMLVGTSAGALNCTGLAPDPSPKGVQHLEQTWLNAKSDELFPGNYLTYAWRLLRGKDSLSDNAGLRAFIQASLPPGVTKFGDLKQVKLHLITANLNTATIYLFGDDPTASLIDAALASSAIPPLFPPVLIGKHQYVDGGAVANVPLSVAVSQGATDIYAVNVGYSGEPSGPVHGVIHIANQTITTLMYQQLLDDLEEIKANPAITLHHIYIPAFQGTPISDLSKTRAMIDEGYRITAEYLSSREPTEPEIPRPVPAPPPPGARIWKAQGRE